MEAELDNFDLEILRKELRQVILIYLIILLIGSIVFFTGLSVILLVKEFNKNWIITTCSLISITVYLAFFWSKVKNPILDLSSKKKLIVSGLEITLPIEHHTLAEAFI